MVRRNPPDSLQTINRGDKQMFKTSSPFQGILRVLLAWGILRQSRHLDKLSTVVSLQRHVCLWWTSAFIFYVYSCFPPIDLLGFRFSSDFVSFKAVYGSVLLPFILHSISNSTVHVDGMLTDKSPIDLLGFPFSSHFVSFRAVYGSVPWSFIIHSIFTVDHVDTLTDVIPWSPCHTSAA